MSKREEINLALKEALKNKDAITLATTRLMVSALKDKDINNRGLGKEPLNDGEILSMLQSMIKQRQESAKMYREANRADLYEREEAEIRVIESFLPKQMSDAEVDSAISSIIQSVGAKDIKDMGKVMNELKGKYAGQLDMAKAGAVIKQKLSA